MRFQHCTATGFSAWSINGCTKHEVLENCSHRKTKCSIHLRRQAGLWYETADTEAPYCVIRVSSGVPPSSLLLSCLVGPWILTLEWEQWDLWMCWALYFSHCQSNVQLFTSLEFYFHEKSFKMFREMPYTLEPLLCRCRNLSLISTHMKNSGKVSYNVIFALGSKDRQMPRTYYLASLA